MPAVDVASALATGHQSGHEATFNAPQVETPSTASAGDRLPALTMAGEKGQNTMKYKVTIKEVSKIIVEVEADSRAAALEQVETEYWKNPNDYCLEPEDTFFE